MFVDICKVCLVKTKAKHRKIIQFGISELHFLLAFILIRNIRLWGRTTNSLVIQFGISELQVAAGHRCIVFHIQYECVATQQMQIPAASDEVLRDAQGWS